MPDNRYRQTTLPLEKLMEITGLTARQLGEHVGKSRCAVQAQKSRGLPIYTADEWALACGYHPIAVWGDDYFVPVRRLKEAS